LIKHCSKEFRGQTANFPWLGIVVGGSCALVRQAGIVFIISSMAQSLIRNLVFAKTRE
jgi:hypothetical protein